MVKVGKGHLCLSLHPASCLEFRHESYNSSSHIVTLNLKAMQKEWQSRKTEIALATDILQTSELNSLPLAFFFFFVMCLKYYSWVSVSSSCNHSLVPQLYL